MAWDTPGVGHMEWNTYGVGHTRSKNQSGHILWSLKFGVDVFQEFLPMKASLEPLHDEKVA